LGIGCRFFRRAMLSFIGFYRSLHLLNLRFFGRASAKEREIDIVYKVDIASVS